jgi:hypothetical protein
LRRDKKHKKIKRVLIMMIRGKQREVERNRKKMKTEEDRRKRE